MTSSAADEECVWIGLDLGTQSVRALAVTGTGRTIGSSAHALTSQRVHRRHEQEPEEWWQAVTYVCRQTMDSVPDSSVRAVAVDATSGSILLTDSAGHPITPAIMYDDARGASYVDRVNDAGAAVWSELGYQRMQPTWALPKLLYLLAEHGPPPAGARLAHQVDLVNSRLTGGDVPTDLSSALKTGAHLVDETWPHAVMDALDVPDGMLPPLVRPGTPIGTVSRAAEETTGIPTGTPVIAGATDGCAAQLGSGALGIGSWNSVLGTTLVLKGVSQSLVHDPLGAVYSHKAPDGEWLPGGASSTGAGAISRDFPDRDLERLDRAAGRFEPAGAVRYPLVSRGERFPFVAPDATGFILGSTRSDAEEFAAILQGVGYIERLCFDCLDLLGAPINGELILTGGATRSPYWSQLRADILGRPVTLVHNSQPALGAAILAASSGRRTADVAAGMVQRQRTINPRPRSTERFTAPYLRLIDEIEQRGWLNGLSAAHARKRAGQ